MKLAHIFLLLLALQVQAQELTTDFKSYITQGKVGVVRDQSYCYQSGGQTYGFQPDKLQRIASVSKLCTTLLAAETLDLHGTFETKIFIGKDSLHIDGGGDPYMEEEKLLLLFRALNHLGYHSFSKVTFTKDFLFNDVPMEQYEKITPEKTLARLRHFFNPQNVSQLRLIWQRVIKFAAEEGIGLEETAPILVAGQISLSEVNPILEENPRVYIHRSRKLHEIIKSMNVQSKNYVAENIFQAATALKPLATFLRENNIPLSSMDFRTGSGLPIIGKNSRFDNRSTCSTMLKILVLLQGSVKKQGLTLSDVMAVNGGKDLGSFRDRFLEYPEISDSVIAKTGTLKQTSTLAGMLLSRESIPFAVLNHSTNTSAARKFQDRFVSRMFDFLGSATPLNYMKIPIFPWDGSEFLVPAQ